MPIETAETIYKLSTLFALLVVAAAFWYMYRNYSRDEVLTRPEVLSRGQLKNVVGFARMVMKNSTPGSPRWADARHREQVAQGELDRRAQSRTLAR
jgi:hypothetical protein